MMSLGLHPKIAGYHDLITVNYVGGMYTGKFDQGANVGKKVARVNGNYVLFSGRPAEKRAEQKFVYIYNNDQGYVLKKLEDWTDK